LTRETAADEVDAFDSIGSKSLGGKGSNVVIARDLGPVFRQNGAGKGFDLAEGNRLHPSPFKAQRKSAYAAEQV
jgi:hypothetical protein